MLITDYVDSMNVKPEYRRIMTQESDYVVHVLPEEK